MKKHTPEEIDAMMSPFEMRPNPIDGYAEWCYKGESKTPAEIAKIANELYRDFCIATVGRRPLTENEIETGLQLEEKETSASVLPDETEESYHAKIKEKYGTFAANLRSKKAQNCDEGRVSAISDICICTNSMEGVTCPVHTHPSGVHAEMMGD